MSAPMVFGMFARVAKHLTQTRGLTTVYQRSCVLLRNPAQTQPLAPAVLCTSQRMCSNSVTQAEDTDEPDALFKTILIEVKGHDPTVLNSYEKFVSMTAHELDIPISKMQVLIVLNGHLQKAIERYTLLKSVHIYKKHRVQYETRTHFRSIQVEKLTGSTADTFLEYIQRNLPEGVAMKVTKYQLETLPDYIQRDVIDTAAAPSS
ncbi:28S ribosomal protein S10, mitochondrial [Lamellibrachia satsuma]|nr:28S ribosomal protein S10, mitochondrial [Lamellibrachia satsuma]